MSERARWHPEAARPAQIADDTHPVDRLGQSQVILRAWVLRAQPVLAMRNMAIVVLVACCCGAVRPVRGATHKPRAECTRGVGRSLSTGGATAVTGEFANSRFAASSLLVIVKADILCDNCRMSPVE